MDKEAEMKAWKSQSSKLSATRKEETSCASSVNTNKPLLRKLKMPSKSKIALQYHTTLTACKHLSPKKMRNTASQTLGQEAYNLIVKTNVYASNNVIVGVLRRQLTLLVIANAVLWMSTLLSLRLFEGEISQMTTFVFAALWLISNGLIYAILNGAKNGKSCR